MLYPSLRMSSPTLGWLLPVEQSEPSAQCFLTNDEDNSYQVVACLSVLTFGGCVVHAHAVTGWPTEMPGPCWGGDYNPEQWPEQVWAQDVSLMKGAGVNLVSVGIFAWARLEVADNQFDFGWLDRVLDHLHAGGVRVCLANATASPPPWLTLANPDMLPVRADGVRLSHGSRQEYCPTSPVYRDRATALTEKLALRYGKHPALAAWHVNNEYGCHVSRCYCDRCAEAFRGWLRARYDLDGLNQAWGTAFWSQHYSSWDQMLPPRLTPAGPNPGLVVGLCSVLLRRAARPVPRRA